METKYPCPRCGVPVPRLATVNFGTEVERTYLCERHGRFVTLETLKPHQVPLPPFTWTGTAKDYKRAREVLGLSQAVVARQLHVSRVTISDWERGKRAIPPQRRLKLELILHEAL